MERRDIVTALTELLRDTLGLGSDISLFLAIVLGVLIVATIPLLVIIGLIWGDRKFGGRVQDRMGPNRVGPFGLLQSFADLGKLLIKEDITPANADRLIYNLAPVLSVSSVILVWAVVPMAPNFVGVDVDTGVLYVVAVASLGTLAVVMGGWASNNKYALLGGFRAVAQLISYEIPMVMALLVPVLFLGTGSLVSIVEAQASMWFVALSPLAALTFFLASQAEVGRSPFDLIEAESELTAGYNVEYSGMKFGMFMAGEYAHWLTQGVLLAVLFFGGWNGPFIDRWPWLGVIYFFREGVRTLLRIRSNPFYHPAFAHRPSDAFQLAMAGTALYLQFAHHGFLVEGAAGAGPGGRFDAISWFHRCVADDGHHVARQSGASTGHDAIPASAWAAAADDGFGEGLNDGQRRSLAAALFLRAEHAFHARRRARRREQPQPRAWLHLAYGESIRCGWLFRPAECAISGCCASTRLYWRHRHPDHLRCNAHARDDEVAKPLFAPMVARCYRSDIGFRHSLRHGY